MYLSFILKDFVNKIDKINPEMIFAVFSTTVMAASMSGFPRFRPALFVKFTDLKGKYDNDSS